MKGRDFGCAAMVIINASADKGLATCADRLAAARRHAVGQTNLSVEASGLVIDTKTPIAVHQIKT